MNMAIVLSFQNHPNWLSFHVMAVNFIYLMCVGGETHFFLSILKRLEFSFKEGHQSLILGAA